LSKPRIWYLPTPYHTNTVFTPELYDRLLRNFDVTVNLSEESISAEQIEENIAEYDGLITGWGTSFISDEALRRADRLKIVAHSAGTVKHLFSVEGIQQYLIPRDTCVVSANQAIGLNVAEHTVGALIAVPRRWFFHAQNIREKGTWKDPASPKSGQYLRGASIGMVSASTVGREVIKLLKPFDVKILLYDPYLTDWDAGRLGVTKTGLDDVFRQADMVTVHAPSIPETRHMIGRDQLQLLRDGAVLVNTSRGSVLDHHALYEEARTGRIHVQLDVTDPEPLPPDHPLRSLENVIITPHTSGSGAYGYARIGRTTVLALEDYFHGKPVNSRVPLDRWDRLA